METLLNILSELHPEVDFETETGLIDDVQIPAVELTPENFNSAQALYALVEKLMDE